MKRNSEQKSITGWRHSI